MPWIEGKHATEGPHCLTHQYITDVKVHNTITAIGHEETEEHGCSVTLGGNCKGTYDRTDKHVECKYSKDDRCEFIFPLRPTRMQWDVSIRSPVVRTGLTRLVCSP